MSDKFSEFLRADAEDIKSRADIYRLFQDDILEMIERGFTAKMIHKYLITQTDIEDIAKGITFIVRSDLLAPAGFKKGELAPVQITEKSTSDFMRSVKKKKQINNLSVKATTVLFDGKAAEKSIKPNKGKEVIKETKEVKNTQESSENPALRKSRIKSNLSNSGVDDKSENSDGVSNSLLSKYKKNKQ